jgi:hypothetical protein
MHRIDGAPSASSVNGGGADYAARPTICFALALCGGSFGTVICVMGATLAALGLWWRLSSGPIELDVATPWLKAAIEENFGGNHTVFVGGTQLERDERGRTSLRLRDIVVRDTDGTIVASAPKAEVGLSGEVSCWAGCVLKASISSGLDVGAN